MAPTRTAPQTASQQRAETSVLNAPTPSPEKREPQQAQVAQEAALLDKIVDSDSRKLDALTGRYRTELDAPGMGAFRRAMLLGQALAALDEALKPELMKRIMQLQNSPLGFMTDEKQGYDEKTVKRCVIQGLLDGVWPFGNELNIISGKAYIAQAGYKRLVEEIEGMTDLDIRPGIPRLDKESGHHAVRVAAQWTLKGMRQQLVGADGKPGRVFAVTNRAGATADNLIGKALRKAYKAIYVRVTGTRTTADDDLDELTAPTPTTNGGEVDPATEANRKALEAEEARNEHSQRIGACDSLVALPALLEAIAADGRLSMGAAADLAKEVERRREELTGGDARE